MTSPVPTTAEPDVHYPESDGKPMGETGWHITALTLLIDALRNFFAGRTDVYVASNMFLYYAQGDPRQNKAPDCMVIIGAGSHERRTFKTWIEGVVPSVIFELSSEETIDEDVRAKRALYARLGVAEYYLFDPVGDCLNPPLQGFHLRGATYTPLAPEPDGGLTSPVLGLRLVSEGPMLRLVDSRTGQPILTSREKSEALDREARRAEEEHRRAETLAAEVERLRALLGRPDRAE